MRHFQAVTLDYVLQKYPFLLVDSNAFIFHYPKEIHQKLQSRQISIEEKKRLVASDESLVLLFYQEWFRILDRHSNLYLTNDILDLELSGHELMTAESKKHYAYKYQNRPYPKGSLIRNFDTPPVQVCKRELWKRLERCRINSIVKTQKPGLREGLRRSLEKQFEGKFSEYRGLSRIDQEIITNTLVFSLLCQKAGAILTNDVLISNTLFDLPVLLESCSQLQEIPKHFDQDYRQISKISISSYYGYRPPQREILRLYHRQRKVASLLEKDQTAKDGANLEKLD
ncbi:MAG: hypothetical protein AABZ60_21775 [Planctomycetota bacterium]